MCFSASSIASKATVRSTSQKGGLGRNPRLQLVNGITARSAVAMVREAGSNENPTGGLVLTNDILGKLLLLQDTGSWETDLVGVQLR
jgi:hypothetical protein